MIVGRVIMIPMGKELPKPKPTSNSSRTMVIHVNNKCLVELLELLMTYANGWTEGPINTCSDGKESVTSAIFGNYDKTDH